ncbi:hypothetical protein GPJ56_001194 [Histomonas meleagridis]|uniref:uncharacterized protein n=1 Tax=Histomonas meleagridis TaxID=135588 RepID=UPI00355A8E13|nr:hypothetical protein GPJ56_001194 [Histomonas meleagridis]KAH0799843.1 hypothetical protein GO595_006955 [Histomonas meleagridis]
MILSIPEGLLAAWVNLGFPKSTRWLIPPKEIIWHLIFSSMTYGIMMCSNNLGIFVSDVDFTVIFKVSGVVWQGLFAAIFLKEKITLYFVVSVSFVIVGTILISAKFQWSTDKMPSFGQFLLQFISIIFQTFSSVSLKKSMNIIEGSERSISLLTFLAWRYFIACIPITFFSLYLEPGAWINMGKILTSQTWLFIVVGSIIGEIFQLVNLSITKKISMISGIILAQLRFVPTLIISHLIYGDTQWTLLQIFGTISLCFGAFIYSFSGFLLSDKQDKKKRHHRHHHRHQKQVEQELLSIEESNNEEKIKINVEEEDEIEKHSSKSSDEAE